MGLSRPPPQMGMARSCPPLPPSTTGGNRNVAAETGEKIKKNMGATAVGLLFFCTFVAYNAPVANTPGAPLTVKTQTDMRISRFITIVMVAWLASTLAATAAPIDARTARATAQIFATQRGKQIVTPTAPLKVKGSTSTHAPYYIYDVENGGGFVIIAGDDRVPSILGYTDSGSYDEATLPDALRDMLADYRHQIEALDSLPEAGQTSQSASAMRAQVAHPSRRFVAPLLPTAWNQKDPYNQLCPVYNNSDGSSSGARSATGCVATALGQMMAYYRYPSATMADIPSYSFTSGGKSIRMDAVAKGTKIDWNNIRNTYSATNTEAEKTAVAQLMVILGTGCQMAYGAASASNMQMGVQLLRDKMGYDETVRNVCRTSYTQAEWTDLLYREVAEGRPVGYRANSTLRGGHAFVIDGYDTADLFHVNWGWGGSSNGYFRISVLYQSEATSVSTANGKGFSLEQEAIIGVKPNDGIDSGIDGTPTLSVRNISVKGSSISTTFTNFTGSAQTGSVGIGVISANGSITKLASSVVLLQNNYEIERTFSVNNLVDGTYRIIPIWKQIGGSKWSACCDASHEYIEAVSAGGKVTLTRHPLNNAKLSVKEWSFVNNRVAGVEQHVKAVISNTGDDYIGDLYLFASTSASTKGKPASTGGVSLVGGKDNEVTMTFTPAAAGTYYIWLARDKNGTQVVGSTQVVITTTDTQAVNLSVGYVAYDNMVGNKVYGNYRRATIILNNKGTADYNGNVVVTLYRGQIGGRTLSPLVTKYISIKVKAGEQTRSVCRFDGLQTGYKYALRLFYEGAKSALDNNNPNAIYSREQHPGIIFYHADGTTSAQVPAAAIDGGSAMAIDMRGVTGINAIAPSTNPNALYLIDATATVPSTLAGKNVVSGTYADRITLTDGYPFMTPVAFTAGSVSYSRTLAAEAKSENNWQTLALPFAPTDISCEGERVSIDQSRLYLRRYAGQNQTLAPIFEPAAAITAAEPFVIKGAGTLKGKTLTFSAVNAQIDASQRLSAETDDYRFKGTTYSPSVAASFTLNTHSNAFDYHSEATQIAPFRAYFVPTAEPAEGECIVIEGTTSGIDATWAEGSTVAVYTLTGVKVGTARIEGQTVNLTGYPQGVYIVGGRKVVKAAR